jgi:hypothetical protein
MKPYFASLMCVSVFLIYKEDIRTNYKSNRTSYKFAANLIRKKFATCEIEIESD